MNQATHEDLRDLCDSLKETNRQLQDQTAKLTRVISNQEHLAKTQAEHHETLYGDKYGLKSRVTRLEILGRVVVWTATSGIAGFVAFWEKIKGWMLGKLG